IEALLKIVAVKHDEIHDRLEGNANALAFFHLPRRPAVHPYGLVMQCFHWLVSSIRSRQDGTGAPEDASGLGDFDRRLNCALRYVRMGALREVRRMTDRLDGIHALVTGAASGIGAACARRMARDGAQLLLADLNGDGAKALADELGQASVQADVTRAADIQRMLELAYQRWGRLDVVFNNAGIAEVRELLELTEDEWDRTLAVNLRAVFFVLQAAARRMRRQTPIAGSELRGKLIQTASIAAYRGGQAYMVHYAASKAGVVSITRTAAQVLAADRITSNCICP